MSPKSRSNCHFCDNPIPQDAGTWLPLYGSGGSSEHYCSRYYWLSEIKAHNKEKRKEIVDASKQQKLTLW